MPVRRIAIINDLAQAFNEAIFPTKCIACGIFLNEARGAFGGSIACGKNDSEPNLDWGVMPEIDPNRCFSTALAGLLCPPCRAGFQPIRPPMCPVCGVMFPSTAGESHICGNCIKTQRHYRKARAAGIYNGTLKTVVHRLKYAGKVQLARPIGRILLMTFIRFWEKGSIDLVVPVPLHVKRLRERGFNQAIVALKEWSQLSKKGLAALHGVDIALNLLVKSRPTLPQTGLSKQERLRNIKNAFHWKGKHGLDGLRVLLVDDVFTTGATVNECGRVLTRAGAKSVDVLTLAKSLQI